MNTTIATVRPLVSITLSANLGTDGTEADFDAWASYVSSHIDDALDIDATVEQAAFTGRNATSGDAVSCDDDDLRETVEGWLSHEGWDAFCSQAAPAA